MKSLFKFILLVMILVSMNSGLVTGEEQGLREFETIPESLYVILLYALWVFFLFVSVLKRGVNGKPIMIFAVFQMVIGFITGILFLKYSILIGIGTIAVATVSMIAGATQR